MARASDWLPFVRDAPCGPRSTLPCEPSHLRGNRPLRGVGFTSP